MTADYLRRAHRMGLDVAPFTLNATADVRGAERAGVDAVITDDPFMTGRAMGLRPLRNFDAAATISGIRLFAIGHLRLPRSVPARQGCRGRVTMRIMVGDRAPRTVRGRVNRSCEFIFSTRRTPPRLGPPLVTILFHGNDRVLPRLDGPERAGLTAPAPGG